MFNAFAVSGLFVLITSAIMAIVMVARERLRIQVVWGIFCALVAIWGLGTFEIGMSQSPQEAVFWWRVAYTGVIFIPVLFTHFVYFFLGKKQYLFLRALYAVSILYLFCDLFNNYFISDVHVMFGSLYYLSPTPLYNSYMALWVVLIPYTHWLLYGEFRTAPPDRRRQIGYFFLGSSVGFVGGSFSFFPVYGLDIYPYENIAIAFAAVIIGYAILRYRLMSLKVVATQGFVSALWVFLFARAALEPVGSQGQVVDGLLLLSTIVIGILLIRSVYMEIEQRELIEKQEKALEAANARQETLLHFISHEIKGYLTKGEAAFAEIVENTKDPAPAPMKALAGGALGEMRKGVATVMDILDASNLKKGTVTFKKSSLDFKTLVMQAIEAQRPAAYEKHLGLDVKIGDGKYVMQGDEEKIRDHVIRNLIDNAIKYTPTGTVHVELSDGGGKIRFMVQDSGVGITPEDMSRLFTEGGHGKDSIKINVHSTGYGLFIAKEVVDAHGGKIWAESDGTGKGARFIVEFTV